jgi:hypothetical protein
MSLKNISSTLFSAVLLTSSFAHANLDALTGMRLGIMATQTLLRAPALPRMDDDKGRATLMANYQYGEVKGYDGTSSSDYSGNFGGLSAGVGYSTAMSKNVGYYIFGMYGTSTGSAKPDGGDYWDFKNTIGVLSGGYARRLLGNEDSFGIVGAFIGPAYMYMNSEMKAPQDDYSSSPAIYGWQAGLQAQLKYKNFRFLPYVMYFGELSPKCKMVSAAKGTPIASSDPCGDDDSGMPIDTTFTAFGLIAGTKTFQVNLFSSIDTSSSLDDVTLGNIGITYSFDK